MDPKTHIKPLFWHSILGPEYYGTPVIASLHPETWLEGALEGFIQYVALLDVLLQKSPRTKPK